MKGTETRLTPLVNWTHFAKITTEWTGERFLTKIVSPLYNGGRPIGVDPLGHEGPARQNHRRWVGRLSSIDSLPAAILDMDGVRHSRGGSNANP
jgi:hypothetical protein